MNKLFIIFFIIAVFSFLACTSTHQSNSLNKLSMKEIKAYNNDPNNTDKIVCKNETPTGSKIPKKVCRRESSIDNRSRKDQQTLENVLNRQNTGTVR